MSPRARELLPYEFEIKNTESLTVWAAIRQAMHRFDDTRGTVPAVVLRKRAAKPLAVVPLGHFCNLLSRKTMLPELVSHPDLIRCWQHREPVGINGGSSACGGPADLDGQARIPPLHQPARQVLQQDLFHSYLTAQLPFPISPPLKRRTPSTSPNNANVDTILATMLRGGGEEMAQLCGVAPIAPLTCAVEAALVHALHNQALHDRLHSTCSAAPAPDAARLLQAAAAAAGAAAGCNRNHYANEEAEEAAFADAVATSVDVDGALLVGGGGSLAAAAAAATRKCWRIKTWEKARLNIWTKYPSSPLTRADAAAARSVFAEAAANQGLAETKIASVWAQHRKEIAAAHGRSADAAPMLVVAQEDCAEMPVFLAMPFDLFLRHSSRRALELNAAVTMAAAQEALLMLRSATG